MSDREKAIAALEKAGFKRYYQSNMFNKHTQDGRCKATVILEVRHDLTPDPNRFVCEGDWALTSLMPSDISMQSTIERWDLKCKQSSLAVRRFWSEQRGIILRGWLALIALAMFGVLSLIALVTKDWELMEIVGPPFIVGVIWSGVNMAINAKRNRDARLVRTAYQTSFRAECVRCGQPHPADEGPFCRNCLEVLKAVQNTSTSGEIAAGFRPSGHMHDSSNEGMIFCRHCGKRIRPGNFCTFCGKEL